MNHRNPEHVVLETIASCTMVLAALAITTLLYQQLITVAVPVLKSVVFAPVAAQGASKTLVAVFAHADDEGAAGPVLARYARQGAQVYLIIATDGAQGGAHTSIPRGQELARVRSEEARCATDALGIHPPMLLGFPDAQLGSYMEDRTRTLPADRSDAGRIATDPTRRRDHLGTGRGNGPSRSSACEQHRDAARSGRRTRRAGALVLRVAASRGISRDESGPRRAVLPDPVGEVFQRPRFVLHGRLRSVPPIDGVPQDAVLGRNRAKRG